MLYLAKKRLFFNLFFELPNLLNILNHLFTYQLFNTSKSYQRTLSYNIIFLYLYEGIRDFIVLENIQYVKRYRSIELY